MSVYSVSVLVIVLLGELLVITGKGGRENMDNVYKFATLWKSSAFTISRSEFLFFTLLFRREIMNFLHMLLTFNRSIHKIFFSYGRNLNYIMAQVFVLVTIYAICSIIMALSFKSIGFVTVCRFISTTVSILSVNVVTLLFINLAAVLKRYFTRINTCLC
jgi:hypothetical protein